MVPSLAIARFMRAIQFPSFAPQNGIARTSRAMTTVNNMFETEH
jgi:hypothetical protein